MKPAEETKKERAGASGGSEERDVTEATRRTRLTRFSEDSWVVRREDGMAAGDALVKGSNSASVTNRQPQHFQGLRNALQASFSLVQFEVGLRCRGGASRSMYSHRDMVLVSRDPLGCWTLKLDCQPQVKDPRWELLQRPAHCQQRSAVWRGNPRPWLAARRLGLSSAQVPRQERWWFWWTHGHLCTEISTRTVSAVEIQAVCTVAMTVDVNSGGGEGKPGLLTLRITEGARDVGWRCKKDAGTTEQFQSRHRWQRRWYCPPFVSQRWGCGSKHWSCVNLLNFYSTLSWWVLLSSLFWQMRNLENREMSNWPNIASCQSRDECPASKAPGLMLPTVPGREGTAFRRKETWTWLLDLFVTSSVTLGKSSDFSVFSPIKKTTPTHLLQNYW